MQKNMTENTETPAVPFRSQLTLRGMLIGAIGSVILTTSSMYVALTLGALPWPIIFVAMVSMFSLKLLGHSNLNEMNVTHTAMSAGAMVAGGIAFTIPGLWMLNPEATISAGYLLLIAVGGVILGLIFTALLRKYFIVTRKLSYPMGIAAAETLQVGDAGGKKSCLLFSSMGFAGLFTVCRDALAWIPNMLFSNVALPGITFGIWASPMMISVGYILGPLAIYAWFGGALIGDFGVVLAGPALGLWDAATAANIKTSLGIGVMVGTGVGIICKSILPQAKEIFSPMFKRNGAGDAPVSLRWAPWAMLLLVVVFTLIADIKLQASIIIIIGAWLATSMSALIVGQSGINPMEIFGVIILLLARLAGEDGMVQMFAIAAIIAVACGLTGDVMNDFKAGFLLKSSPKAQWCAEAIGALIGAVVSALVLLLLVKAYGTGAFGLEGRFVAPQAGVVSAMVGGIPHQVSFWIGLAAGALLYLCNVPVMTLGLGIYLPFYLSLTVFLGGLCKLVLDKVCPRLDQNGNGLILASGLLGGEAVVGVIIALVQVAGGLAAL